MSEISILLYIIDFLLPGTASYHITDNRVAYLLWMSKLGTCLWLKLFQKHLISKLHVYISMEKQKQTQLDVGTCVSQVSTSNMALRIELAKAKYKLFKTKRFMYSESSNICPHLK